MRIDLRVLLLAAAMCAGCSHVIVKKVPSGPEGDGIAGFRYYLPRPYVAVKQEFAVENRDELLNGKIGADGSITLDPGDLKRINAQAESILDSPIAVPAEVMSGLMARPAGDDAAPAEETAAPTVTIRSGARNDAPALAGGYVPINGGPFDIVYLPDYDQQYAIDFHGRGGVAELNYKLTHGWMLESVAIKTDDTALTRALFEQIGKLLDFGTSAASGKLGVKAASAATRSGGGLQGLFKERALGGSLLIRVHRTRYAVPGLYPVYKPAELQERNRRAQANPPPGGEPAGLQQWKFSSPLWGDAVDFKTRVEVSLELVRVDAAAKSRSRTLNDIKDDLDALFAKNRVGLSIRGLSVDARDANHLKLVVLVAAAARSAEIERATALANQDRSLLKSDQQSFDSCVIRKADP